MQNLDTLYTDATCYESEMRYPTDPKLLWEGIEKSYETLCELSARLGIHRLFTLKVNVSEADKDALKESVAGLPLQTLANCIEVDSDSDIAMLLFDNLDIRGFHKQTLYEIVKKDGTKVTIPVSKRLYYIPFDDGSGAVVQASANFIGQYDAERGVMIGGKNTNKKEKTMFGIVKHKTGSEEEFLALYY